MKTKLLLAALTSLCLTPLHAAESSGAKAAPDFSLTDSKGKTHALSDYKGKYVVLEWFNPECPFVKKHYGANNMQKVQKEYRGKDVVWLAVDSSAAGTEGYLTPEQANQKMDEWKINATAFLIDAEGKVGKAYGAKTTPHMFVINPEGKLIYEGGIDNKPSTSQGDIASSTNYVKVALDESMAGKPVTTSQAKPYGCSVKYK